jgi:hypothetical protein
MDKGENHLIGESFVGKSDLSIFEIKLILDKPLLSRIRFPSGILSKYFMNKILVNV